MAIDEINASGGLLGKKLVPILKDGKSDPLVFAKEAENLIKHEEVVVLFGCWTSSSRKEVKPFVEAYDHLLFYPLQYEGLEESPNIVYTGAAPNQQLLPAVGWAIDHLGKKFFLVGSDYIFPHTANAIIKDRISELGGEVLGESYRRLGHQDFDSLVDSIIQASPDVILNNINGDSNKDFFKALKKKGISPDQTPCISFSFGEPELQAMGVKDFVGNYHALNYFQHLSEPKNQAFVSSFKKRLGPGQVTGDPIESAYNAVNLWAIGVKKAGLESPEAVREHLRGLAYHSPGGPVTIDKENQHLWKKARIGKVLEDGQFQIIWESKNPIQPLPFPASRKISEWKVFLHTKYVAWNKNWSKPE